MAKTLDSVVVRFFPSHHVAYATWKGYEEGQKSKEVETLDPLAFLWLREEGGYFPLYACDEATGRWWRVKGNGFRDWEELTPENQP